MGGCSGTPLHHYPETRYWTSRLRQSFKDMSEFFPALRMARCEHHYVFCLPRKDAPALIVAIFHERMDLLARLADRLKL